VLKLKRRVRADNYRNNSSRNKTKSTLNVQV
jgi:hypothetical protein